MPKSWLEKLGIKTIEDEEILEHIPKVKIYVPVSDGYTKPYNERWADGSYLEAVSRLSQNKCLTSELINTLSKMRNHADVAQTPEELKGINKCIAEMKVLLSVSKKASDTILYRKQSEMENNNAPTG